jgi:N-acetylmuramoyl-L-alanine amidase
MVNYFYTILVDFRQVFPCLRVVNKDIITSMDNLPFPQTPKTPSGQAHPILPKFTFWTALQTITSTAVIIATLLTLWTPTNLFSGDIFNAMIKALNATPEAQLDLPNAPTPRSRIGIVAGHDGFDPGAVCSDGLTEQFVNMQIATLVRQEIIKTNPELQIDLLQEYDLRLTGYEALGLISIHNDSCDYFNEEATGFKVAAAKGMIYPEKANRLSACLIDRYRRKTGLRFHKDTITPDMSEYHAFNEINSNTPAVIIETGFLNLDRQILTEQTDLVAQGIVEGIYCFLRNENIPDYIFTPTPGEARSEPIQ